MKTIFIFPFVLVLACIFSCGHRDYPASLRVADSLCEVNPDSAVAFVEGLSSRQFEFDGDARWYYRLLRLKAKCKAYIEYVEEDRPETMAVLEHYKNGGDRSLLPFAYYYAGCVVRDLGDAPAAIEYFQHAMDALADTTNLQFRSALNFRTGFLLLNQGVYAPALGYFRESYRLERQRKDTAMMVYCLEKLAFTYRDSHDMDSALLYFNRAISLAKTQRDTLLVKRITASVASYYLIKKEYLKADSCLASYIKYVNNADKMVFYGMMADVCMNTGRYDEGYSYCMKIKNGGGIYFKQKACRLLVKYYAARDDVRNVSKYLELFDEYTDSVKRVESAEVTARMDASYNYSEYKRRAAELEVANARANMWKMFYGSLAFVLAVLFVVFYWWAHKRAKARELRFETLVREMAEHSDAYIKELEKRMADLRLKLGEAEKHGLEQAEQLEQQRAQLEALVDMANRRRSIRATIKERLAGSPIYNKVKKAADENVILPDEQWDELDRFVNELIPDFKPRLYGICRLSAQDYRLCLLIRLGGLSGTDMAAVMGRTKSAVSKAKAKLLDKFIGPGREAATLDDFIVSL